MLRGVTKDSSAAAAAEQISCDGCIARYEPSMQCWNVGRTGILGLRVVPLANVGSSLVRAIAAYVR